uniref:Protein tweety homolog n=1 Tax=Heterorhabditis bacteriophora TaxID=37862 RepID=A0A1I7XMC3_HETBA
MGLKKTLFSFFLGFCLFGNEHINRGITSSVTGLADVNHGFRLAIAQTNTLNDTCQNATLHIKQLEEIVHKKSKVAGINHTLVEQVDILLTSLSDSVDSVTGGLNGLQKILSAISFLENARFYGERIELERDHLEFRQPSIDVSHITHRQCCVFGAGWMLLVTLLSIMMCVLFAGVIAFCRQSKKGAIVFSGLGIVIFIVVWTLFCLVLPATVALADMCSSGSNFIRSHLSPPMISALEFYRTCDVRPTHDNVPPIMGASNISETLTAIQNTKTKLDSLLDTTFNHSVIISNTSALIADDSTRSLKGIGALESTLACYAYGEDVRAMHYGLCNQAVVGASVLTCFLLCLGVFLFTLLIIVSRSWNLFSRLTSLLDMHSSLCPLMTCSLAPED